MSQRVPGCKHAFLPQEDALYRGDIGVENASPEAVRRALSTVRTEDNPEQAEITNADLMEAGLLVHSDAAQTASDGQPARYRLLQRQAIPEALHELPDHSGGIRTSGQGDGGGD